MIKGLTFHCHHDTLVEYVHNYDERVNAIKRDKPQNEQELRLRLFKMIPDDLLPQRGLVAYHKAWDAYNKAWDARDKAWDAYNKAWDARDKAWDARDKARDAYNKAWDARDKARDARDKARDAYVKHNKVVFEKLHTKLCPNCPWNGETIFTRKDVNGNWY